MDKASSNVANNVPVSVELIFSAMSMREGEERREKREGREREREREREERERVDSCGF